MKRVKTWQDFFPLDVITDKGIENPCAFSAWKLTLNALVRIRAL